MDVKSPGAHSEHLTTPTGQAPTAGTHHEVDIVVVGSGAGGLAAALSARERGAEVLVVEKALVFGGSTALSGGGVWVPNNPALIRSGVEDNPRDVITYLTTITAGRVEPERIRAYVHEGPRAMELLERSRWIRFRWVRGYSDYHPEANGGRAGGRSVEPLPVDTRKLCEDENLQHRNTMRGPLGLWVTQREYRNLALAKRTWAGRRASVIAAWRVISNLVRRRHMATGGRALTVRMWLAARDAGVEIWLGSPMLRILHDTDSQEVTGIVVDRDGEEITVHARRGVIVAAGGFEHDEAMRKEHLPVGAQANASMGATSNTGDGIRAGMALGAATDLLDEAWWMPSVRTPDGVIPLVSERSIPNHVIVDAAGKRFTNEAAPYVTFVHRQLAGNHERAWFVMDARGRSRYPFARVLPGQGFPDSWYASGLVVKAESLTELEVAVGFPRGTLVQSVDRFNMHVAAGTDSDFGRGESVYDHYYGDPTMPSNPCLGPVGKAPFYAIQIEIGDLGTKGGLVSDHEARVLDDANQAIPGLYAVGNSSASVMGDEYAGPGATIGPAIVFGYIAANNAMNRRPHSRATCSQPSAG